MYVGISKVTSKGQVTIPAEIRASKKFVEGSDLVFIDLDDAVIIKKSKDLDSIFQIFSEKARNLGLTRKMLDKEVDLEKDNTLKKHYA
ncbi:MAG: AbrB/MazE/SpoVT family DNA-binding domain-containing protein [Nanoarchaeota archaeon]